MAAQSRSSEVSRAVEATPQELVVTGAWGGVFSAKNLPPAQLAFWEEAMRQVSQNPGWKADLERNYWLDDFTVGAQFRKELEKDYAETRKVLVDVGLAK